jgi:hypothetical protein
VTEYSSVVRTRVPLRLHALLLALLLLAGPAGAQPAPADSAAAGQTAPQAPPAETPQVLESTGAPAPAAAPQAPVAAAAVPDTTAPDGGWPRAIQTPSGGMIVMYQPQVLSWDKQRHMVAMMAVSFTPKGATRPALGTVKLESPTSASLEERMMNFEKVELTSMSFQSLEKSQAKEVLEEVKRSLPHENMLVSLDRILAAVDRSQISTEGIQVNTDPPPVYFSKKPAILLQFDAEPIMMAISGTSLSYAVNTNWDFFTDNSTNFHYLRKDAYWLMTKDWKKWEVVKKLPAGFEQLADDDNWKEVKAHIPAKKPKEKVPVVFVAKKPGELIQFDGSPKFDEIDKDLKLLWAHNTESDVFRMKEKPGDYYVLLSGRWFKTEDIEKGPWVFATKDLPPEFAKIPKSHDRAHVLASVPGTEEASTAILLAQIPRTARVDAKNLAAPVVTYSGDPSFKPVEGARGVSYAENSAYDVLKFGNDYYLCFQAVWFRASSPTGPWKVATSVPEEIYAIPPSSPAHHVTYVTVVDDDDDYPVYGYTAGYVGVTIAFGCAMYGTGWYYPPYYGYGGYYPRPVAYGAGVAYNPWTGSFGGYQTAYGPYGGVARGASYNPSTGTYKRGAMAWGPTGASGWATAYNPRTGTAAGTRQGSNVYGSWGSSHVQRGDDWVKSQRVTDNQGNTKWKAQGSGGGSASGWRTDQGSGFVGQKGDDLYAGRNGDVYRKTDSGWQEYNRGEGWSDVDRGQAGQQPAGGRGDGSRGDGNRPSQQPSAGTSDRPSAGTSDRPSAGQLDREAQARSQGNQRTRDYNNYQRSGGSSSRGSYSGGGGRGGGGGRRR